MSLSVAQLKARIGKVFLLDVREDYEVADGIIKTAVHIKMGDVLKAFSLDAAAFTALYNVPKPTPDTPIVVYCQSGARSQVAYWILKSRGYSVENLDGGIEAWHQLESRSS